MFLTYGKNRESSKGNIRQIKFYLTGFSQKFRKNFVRFQYVRDNVRFVKSVDKASFCLEDNDCEGEADRQFDCDAIGGGEQGITQGCADTYLYNLGILHYLLLRYF